MLSQNFNIGSRDVGHTHLGVILRFMRKKDSSSISVPNLKQVGQVITLPRCYNGDVSFLWEKWKL